MTSDSPKMTNVKAGLSVSGTLSFSSRFVESHVAYLGLICTRTAAWSGDRYEVSPQVSSRSKGFPFGGRSLNRAVQA